MIVKLHASIRVIPLLLSAGTYAGMVERLDYLASLGVNALELLPVQVRCIITIPCLFPPFSLFTPSARACCLPPRMLYCLLP